MSGHRKLKLLNELSRPIHNVVSTSFCIVLNNEFIFSKFNSREYNILLITQLQKLHFC